MTSPKKNRTLTQGKDQHVIEGISTKLQSWEVLRLGGTIYTPATLSAYIQSRIDAANQVEIDKARWLASGKAYDALDKHCSQVVHDLKQAVIAAFGSNAPELADFGFAPRKVTTLTPEQKAVAKEKRLATRKARGTMGPKAKLKITGENAGEGGTGGPVKS